MKKTLKTKNKLQSWLEHLQGSSHFLCVYLCGGEHAVDNLKYPAAITSTGRTRG